MSAADRIVSMETVTRDDGIELHVHERGEGPVIVIASYWSMLPSFLEPIVAELAIDHRVVLYDDRGYGASTRRGPYDRETAADDLEAVVEAAQPGADGAIVLGLADGVNRADRVGARRGDLVRAVVAMGFPFPRTAFAGSEAMAGSDTVVGALLEMMERDYRGGMRSVITAGNAQMTEDEMRDRVREQIEYAPQEPAVARLRTWAEDDTSEEARALGDRLWLLLTEDIASGWFPTGEELEDLAARILPDAHLERIDDGMVSRPDLTAAVIRRITAA